MPVAVEGLRKLLQDFNARTGARMSAIVSRSGVPVAWVLPDEAPRDLDMGSSPAPAARAQGPVAER